VGGSSLSLDLVTPSGSLLSLEQAGDRSARLLRPLVAGASPLGVEDVRGEAWRCCGSPRSDLLLVRRYADDAEVAAHGGRSVAELRALVASLEGASASGLPA
jgi:Protein of unknown function (DUF4245)